MMEEKSSLVKVNFTYHVSYIQAVRLLIQLNKPTGQKAKKSVIKLPKTKTMLQKVLQKKKNAFPNSNRGRNYLGGKEIAS